MDTDVWILGGYQSDFARNLRKEGHDFADLTGEVVDTALTAAKVNAADIGVGLRMLVDAAKQVSGTAGDYQVENAKTFGTLNFGGSTATTVSFVVSQA